MEPGPGKGPSPTVSATCVPGDVATVNLLVLDTLRPRATPTPPRTRGLPRQPEKPFVEIMHAAENGK